MMTGNTWARENVLSRPVQQVLSRMREHDFEGNSGYDGVGDLADEAWLVRTLAIRDLVRLGPRAVPAVVSGLSDKNRHVRHVCVAALGILGARGAGEELLQLLTGDPDPIVRAQVAEALGQIGYKQATAALEGVMKEDTSKHVRHRAKLALGRIKEGKKERQGLISTWASLDEKTFRQLEVGKPAPEFTLKDTSGRKWRLSTFKGKKTVMLVWIFADWCPVCQREFHDLIKMEDQFKQAGVQVLTIECHDLHRCKEMVAGRDLWWPHLVDTAGKVAAVYNVDPMEFVVHDEWINRPSTIIVDRQGIVRFAYYGTFWGDRPTIEESLEMIKTNSYSFRHPKRRD